MSLPGCGGTRPKLPPAPTTGQLIDVHCHLFNGTDLPITRFLTRVALKKGSLVVNSSQGGGSKDTWILAGETEEPQS